MKVVIVAAAWEVNLRLSQLVGPLWDKMTWYDVLSHHAGTELARNQTQMMVWNGLTKQDRL